MPIVQLPVQLCAQAVSSTVLQPVSEQFTLPPTMQFRYAPTVLPPQRPSFLEVPDEPPDTPFEKIPSTVVDKIVAKPPILPVAIKNDSHRLANCANFSQSRGKSFFAPRPLQLFTFCDRAAPHHSIILQIDGLLFACFRLRLERDVCAQSFDVSFCMGFGPGVSPASTFCGLYMPRQDALRGVIQAVKEERGYGVFVGPVSCNAWSLLQQKAVLLCFTFSGPDSHPWQGFFLSFAYQGKVKRKKPDSLFLIEPMFYPHIPRRVALLPFCPARISSLPHSPVLRDDTAKRSAPLPVMRGVPLPCQTPVWCADEMSKLADRFPHKDVAKMFSVAILPSGAPLLFAGDRSKRVVTSNGALDPDILQQITDRFTSEVSKGRMMGPFDRCPFPNEWCPFQARATPLDTRRKDKYNPLSTRFRVISNFSAGLSRSINALCYSPKLISSHLQGANLRDVLFSLGPRARFDAIDQEDAFRADQINLVDAHLYCYQVGDLWFIDLRDPFGNVKSEYTYAIIVAVIKWAFECDQDIVTTGNYLLGFVDNWFLISRATCLSHDARWAVLKDSFKRLGAPMHEEQRSCNGTVNALGWDWDLQAGCFSCPEDKYRHVVRTTGEWALRVTANEVFTFAEIESLAGLFQWISIACPAIIPSIASLQALKHSMESSGAVSRHLDERSKLAVTYLASFFLSWNRTSTLFAGFSPVYMWEVLIKVDASTDFGMGGFCLPSFDCLVHEWLPSERAMALTHCANPIRESTTFFELLGILRMLTLFSVSCRGKRVQIECDNEAAVRDLVSCFSGRPMCLDIISQIRDLCAAFSIIPRFEHILSQFNSIADRLSHDDFTQADVLCNAEFHRSLQPPSRL